MTDSPAMVAKLTKRAKSFSGFHGFFVVLAIFALIVDPAVVAQEATS